jgi:hypothetical protein
MSYWLALFLRHHPGRIFRLRAEILCMPCRTCRLNGTVTWKSVENAPGSVPLQLIPSHPSLHSHGFPSSRSLRCSPSASESHSVQWIDMAHLPGKHGKNSRGTRQSIPPHPGGHLHWPLYGSQVPYCPQVNAGRRQLKHGGHLGSEVHATSLIKWPIER